MEIQKENTANTQSKIPVLKKSLPHVQQVLLKSQERHPLKTINWHHENQPSTSGTTTEKTDKLKNKKKSPVNIKSQHVTVRQNIEDLDWDYIVFKDNLSENSKSTIKNDCESVESSNDEESAVTPAIKLTSLEVSRIKNIKSSLKRPHSRELQGLSPQQKQAKGEERYRRRLEFNECLQRNEQVRLESSNYWKRTFMTSLNRSYTDDLFEHLLNIENGTGKPQITSEIRACLINWLMRVHGPDGNPAVIQSARWYLDSVLAISYYQLSSLQILAAACYWIAQKIHGPPMRASKLVKCSRDAFTAKTLLLAEKNVLCKLKFPPQPVIPQDFISHMSWWCDSKYPEKTEITATFICMVGLMVNTSLCKEYPSVIAAAAVRNAVLLLKNEDALAKLKYNSIYKAAESKVLSSISNICSIQRKAVHLISLPLYKYKVPLEQFSTPPHHVAQKLIDSIKKLEKK